MIHLNIMKNEQEYRIINRESKDDLEITIDEWLTKGWELQGGISLTDRQWSRAINWIQAMVRKKKGLLK